MARYTRSKPGKPSSGIYNFGDVVTDSLGIEWLCVKTGRASREGTFVANPQTASPSAGAGAIAGTLIEASDNFAPVRSTLLTLSARLVTVTDALAYASSKLYDFPEGRILVFGAKASLQWAVTSDRTTTINLNADLDWAIGSAAASNVTLATTMVDFIAKQDKQLTAAGATLNTASAASAGTPFTLDGTSTPVDLYLNVAFPTLTDIDADGTMTATGTVLITWVNLGDI